MGLQIFFLPFVSPFLSHDGTSLQTQTGKTSAKNKTVIIITLKTDGVN
jgi:hypothetical protein